MFRFLFRERNNRIAAIVGILLSVSILTASISAVVSVLRDHEQRLYEQEVQRIGRLVSLGLVTDEDLPEILAETDRYDFEAGLEALGPFGYEEEPPEAITKYYQQVMSALVYTGAGSAVLLVLLWTILLALLARKHCLFLREIASIIDSMMSGQFNVVPILKKEGEAAVLYAQLDAMGRRFDRTMKEVQMERDKMRSFISFISHELKTPAASMKTMNELMLEDSEMSRNQINEFLSRSQNDIERMEWLIDDVLNIARIEAGSVRFSFEKRDLGTLTREVADRYSEIARSKDLTIRVNTESEVPVFCDDRWLSQAIDNVVKNAIDYSPVKGTVSIEITSGDTYARLSVIDQGPGIPASESSKIFQGFYRGSGSGKLKKGSGLGLSLARAVAIRHGGDIRLKRAGEKGSTFVIELPIRGSS